MNGMDLVPDRPAQPAPVTERLFDFCRELHSRTGERVRLTLRLDGRSWHAVREAFQRPYHPKPTTFCVNDSWGSMWFERDDR